MEQNSIKDKIFTKYKMSVERGESGERWKRDGGEMEDRWRIGEGEVKERWRGGEAEVGEGRGERWRYGENFIYPSLLIFVSFFVPLRELCDQVSSIQRHQ
jgi:hypothetical protein